MFRGKPRVSKVIGLLALPAALVLLAGPALRSAAQDDKEAAVQSVGAEPQSPEAARTEAGILAEVNRIRKERGKSELVLAERVAAVARAYSRRMLKEGFFSHTSPNGNGPGDRVRKAGLEFTAVGENLYRANNIPMSRIPITSTEWWMGSPGHRSTLLSEDYRSSGIGVWQEGQQIYVTHLYFRGTGKRAGK